MIIASHVIVSTYGFWLPNDPRGSWSDFVRSWELLKFGPATKVTTRRSVAGVPHNAALRAAAKRALLYPPVVFDGYQALSVANGFGNVIRKTGATVYACAILPEHVHLVITRHRYSMQQLVNLMKGRATRQLMADGRHPLAQCRLSDGSLPTPWGRRFWMVFIDDEAHLRQAINYVENNPLKEGKQRQKWSFVSQL
jgi:REP element-mobilizing transposase RayT